MFKNSSCYELSLLIILESLISKTSFVLTYDSSRFFCICYEREDSSFATHLYLLFEKEKDKGVFSKINLSFKKYLKSSCEI
ncbi:hypothetical protein AB751O23_AL_00150 [Chlamydiales bacterium SCGC AB-751-O23]|nr:hypothetical protein AB751O23_AL_00150 [Chlamydiales bacterium SCGC AB-751-O23]